MEQGHVVLLFVDLWLKVYPSSSDMTYTTQKCHCEFVRRMHGGWGGGQGNRIAEPKIKSEDKKQF